MVLKSYLFGLYVLGVFSSKEKAYQFVEELTNTQKSKIFEDDYFCFSFEPDTPISLEQLFDYDKNKMLKANQKFGRHRVHP